jgi:hypothetical protein
MLVSDETAASLEQPVPSLVHPLQLLGLAARYEGDADWWSPARIAAFAKVLHEHDLIDQAQLPRIEAAAAAGQLPTPFELLAFCKRARGFDLAKYPEDLAAYLPAIHRDVAALDPVLAFQSFSYQIRRDPKLRGNSQLPGTAAHRSPCAPRTARIRTAAPSGSRGAASAPPGRSTCSSSTKCSTRSLPTPARPSAFTCSVSGYGTPR